MSGPHPAGPAPPRVEARSSRRGSRRQTSLALTKGHFFGEHLIPVVWVDRHERHAKGRRIDDGLPLDHALPVLVPVSLRVARWQRTSDVVRARTGVMRAQGAAGTATALQGACAAHAHRVRTHHSVRARAAACESVPRGHRLRGLGS
eukprot:7381333-Prymnesium_polylepis.1